MIDKDKAIKDKDGDALRFHGDDIRGYVVEYKTYPITAFGDSVGEALAHAYLKKRLWINERRGLKGC